MRSLLLICTMLVTAAGAAAQQQTVPQRVNLTGKVAAPDGSGLASAAISIRGARDTVLVAGTLTGNEGGFQIPGLSPGRYSVRVSLVGYTPVSLEVDVAAGATSVSVGVIRLSANPIALDPLEVSGARAPVVLGADRTIYDTRQMPVAEAGVAADVLRHIDELEVDFNGRVTMRGDRPVVIHINGRPAPLRGEQLQEFLQQMPGKSIARVEVLPNPSARYDPEGMGGIVNIVLRTDAPLGVSGNVGANANTVGARGLSGRIAVQKGRVTFFGGGSGTMSRLQNERFDLRESLRTSPASVFEQTSSSRGENLIAFGDFSLEYKVGAQTTAWANGYASSHAHDTRSEVTHSIYTDREGFSDWFVRHVEATSPHTFVDWGVGIKRGEDSRTSELTADLRWNENRARTNTRTLRTESLDAARIGETQRDGSSEVTGVWTLRADYRYPFGGRGAIATGFAASRRNLNEDERREIHNAASGSAVVKPNENTFDYHESIEAAYITADMNAGRFTGQLGLRGELASARFHNGNPSDELMNEYRSLFPSVNLAYRIDDTRILRIGYSKRVGRPPAHLLNSHRASTDPTVRLQGNPALGPNYTHTVNAELAWVGTRGTLRFAPYYRKAFDSWEQVRTLQDDGIMLITWANTATVRQAGTTLTLARPASGRIGGSLNAALYHNLIDATNISADYRRASIRWSTGATAQLKLSDLATATLNANYMAPRDLPQGRMGASLNSSVGLRQQVLARTATISLMIMDPFDLHRFNMQSHDQTFVQRSRTAPRIRGASVAFTWNMGKQPRQQSRRETDVPPGD